MPIMPLPSFFTPLFAFAFILAFYILFPTYYTSLQHHQTPTADWGQSVFK